VRQPCHSDADFAATLRGIEAGGRHARTRSTPCGSGARRSGILGAVLTDTRVTADIIAEPAFTWIRHCPLVPEVKGLEQAVLITDGMAATGMPDGRYRLGPLEVEVKDAAV